MLGLIAKSSYSFQLQQHKHSQPAVYSCTGIEIASHIEFIQDPFPKWAAGEKGPETSEVSSSLGLGIGLSQTQKPLNL